MDLRREKKRAIMRYAGYVAGTLGVGGLSALLSRGGMEAFAHLKKPSFSPPGWVFPAAWTLLYILMAVSAAMIAGERTKQSRDALFTYCAQLFVNFWWSIFFFAWGLRLTAFFWLLLLLALAVATSIDALAVGITFAFLPGTHIVPAVALIGSITFVFSAAGIRLGNVFGLRYKRKAEFAGGVILILLGTKILLEHLGVL